MSAKLDNFVSYANTQLGRSINFIGMPALDRVCVATSFPIVHQREERNDLPVYFPSIYLEGTDGQQRFLPQKECQIAQEVAAHVIHNKGFRADRGVQIDTNYKELGISDPAAFLVNLNSMKHNIYHFLLTLKIDTLCAAHGFRRTKDNESVRMMVQRYIVADLHGEYAKLCGGSQFDEDVARILFNDRIIALAEIYLILPQEQRETMFAGENGYWKKEVESFVTAMGMNMRAEDLYCEEYDRVFTSARFEGLLSAGLDHFSASGRVFRSVLVDREEYYKVVNNRIFHKMQESGPIEIGPGGTMNVHKGENWYEAYAMAIANPADQEQAEPLITACEMTLLDMVHGGSLQDRVWAIAGEFQKRSLDRAAALFVDRIFTRYAPQ